MKRLLCLVLLGILLAGACAAGMPESAPLYEAGGLLCVVNKQQRIAADYEPDDLVTPKVPTRKASLQERIEMRAEAAKKLEELFSAAKREKAFTLYAVSGYRSYGIQQINFSAKLRSVGGDREKAALTVAPPGASEHQLGLAMDIQSVNFHNLNRGFGETEEGIWLRDNAHRFGFILRYPEAMQEVTGFAYEPWHFRYVGVAHARAIHALQITLEEYVQLVGALPDYVVRGGSDILLAGLVRDMRAGDTAAAMGLSGAADREAALRGATQRYLPDGTTYEAALWACYPTPRPTSAPRVDSDVEEVSLFAQGGA